MKKYIEPKATLVEVSYQGVIAGSLRGDGINVNISNGTVSGDADAKGMTPVSEDNASSLWED